MGGMKYKIKNGKYVFEKDDVYYAMTLEQVKEMLKLCEEIIKNNPIVD